MVRVRCRRTVRLGADVFFARELGRNPFFFFFLRARTRIPFSIDRLSTVIDAPFYSRRPLLFAGDCLPRSKSCRTLGRHSRTGKHSGGDVFEAGLRCFFPAEHEMRGDLKVPPCFRCRCESPPSALCVGFWARTEPGRLDTLLEPRSYDAGCTRQRGFGARSTSRQQFPARSSAGGVSRRERRGVGVGIELALFSYFRRRALTSARRRRWFLLKLALTCLAAGGKVACRIWYLVVNWT